MIVESILKEKGHAVETIRDAASLREAARLLDTKRIGAVVALTESGALAGVLSERDIVRLIARKGAAALDMAVSDAMTRGVITASSGEEVERCLGRMTDRRIRHLPVLEEGKLRGIVSIGDLVKYKIDSVLAEAEAMTAYIRSG